ncbi:MAG: DNA-binding protein [Acidobacteria bacterium]|nr:MAG: DNA-binding protein [Acidobacteriota bacterium]
MPKSISPRLLTPDEVAEYLNITVSQVYTLMRDGELVALKIGKRGVWRVDRDELDAYISRLKSEAEKRIESQHGKRARPRRRTSNR